MLQISQQKFKQHVYTTIDSQLPNYSIKYLKKPREDNSKDAIWYELT